LSLTDHQRQIVEAGPDCRQLVIAGPGTGKTYCLIERLKHLINKENLQPGTEILVLSFSVAAIQEVRKRLREAVENGECDEYVQFANIRTFDSFASHFMLRINPDIVLEGKDYDERIRMASEMIVSEEKARERLGIYKHVLVDEIQDLVGIRARLTQLVLENCGGGITLLGDPAQAIYEYLVKDTEGPSSAQFIQWVKERFRNLQVRDYLKKNHRTATGSGLSRIANEGRDLLLEGNTEKAFSHLRGYISGLNSIGRLNEPGIQEQYRNPDTAILCRTNGQVLCLARALQERKIRFTIRRGLEERIIPRWVGRVFSGLMSPSVQKTEFSDRYAARVGEGGPPAESAWETLKEAEGGRSKRSIDISVLRHALLFESVLIPPANNNGMDERVILSSIHRSKGREYERVIVVMPDNPVVGLEELEGESRVLFVALTRAKEELFSVSEKGSRGFRLVNSQNRWVRAFPGNYGGGRFHGVEIRNGSDTDLYSFVSPKVHEGLGGVRENQEDLWERVQLDMDARLRLENVEEGCPSYLVEVDLDGKGTQVVFGATSKRFGWSLRDCIREIQGGTPRKYPDSIDGLWVKDICTEVGDLGNDQVPREYRTTGMWLGLRIEGIGKCHW